MAMPGKARRVGGFIFYFLVLIFVLDARAQEAGGLPVFTQQPRCENTGSAEVLRLRAEVTGAETLQWLSNNVPVPGATNLTIEFAPNLTNLTAYVLVASNRLGVVPSDLAWADMCEEVGTGVVQLNSTEQLVFNWDDTPWATGQVRLYLTRALERTDPISRPYGPLEVRDGRIDNEPITVRFRPGTRVYGQFTMVDELGFENGRSKIFEATVGTTNSPGSLDAVQSWKDRAWDCYGQWSRTLWQFDVKTGRKAIIRHHSGLGGCGALGTVVYDDNYRGGFWRKNGAPLENTHPIYQENWIVTLADAGVYEFCERDDYTSPTQRRKVSLTHPAEFGVTRTPPVQNAITLLFRSEITGAYRLEMSTDLVNWALLQEGNYTNAGSTVEVPIAGVFGRYFYRLK